MHRKLTEIDEFLECKRRQATSVTCRHLSSNNKFSDRSECVLQMSSLKVESGKQQRIKVALKPRRSLLDWIRFSRATDNLSGTDGQLLEVTQEDLQLHSKPDDFWLLVKGNVYNVTPFMEYHPGGVDELLRGAGMDSTDLFNSVHRWVNIESMLAKCLVGRLKPGTVIEKAPLS